LIEAKELGLALLIDVVEAEVDDFGCGLRKQIAEQIFDEPFDDRFEIVVHASIPWSTMLAEKFSLRARMLRSSAAAERRSGGAAERRWTIITITANDRCDGYGYDCCRRSCEQTPNKQTSNKQKPNQFSSVAS
jgi:hypothetical protein